MISGHVTILRALNGLGDFLCLTPALRALRDATGIERITLIGSPSTEAMVLPRFRHLIDEFRAFPGFPGIVEIPASPHGLAAFLREDARKRPADWAIQMQGNGSVTNSFIGLVQAKRTAGYHLPGLWCPDADTYFPFPDDLSEPSRWHALVTGLGCPDRGPALELPVAAAERAEAHGLCGVPGSYAIVHAGASDHRRAWPADRFAAIGEVLAQRGLTVVLTGTRGERDTVTRVRATMRAEAVDLVGRTDLGVLAAAVEGARLVVASDTGISHVAAAMKTPSVVVFSVSDPARWAPEDRRFHVPVGPGVPDPIVGRSIAPPTIVVPGVAEVLSAVETQLASPPALASAA